MKIFKTLLFLINLIFLFKKIQTETCFSYLNDGGQSSLEISCQSNQIYCCGDCNNRYCCDNATQKLDQFKCSNNVDFCNSYFDSDSKYVQTFVCVYNTNYCCGDCKTKRCCGSYNKKLNQSICSTESSTKSIPSSNNSSSPSNLIYICVAVSVFVICMLVMALPILIIFLKYRKKSRPVTFNNISREVSTVSRTVNENNSLVDIPPRYENLETSDTLNPANPPPYPGNIKV